MSGPFKMSGSQFLGKGNQSKTSSNQEVASAAPYASPAKNDKDKTGNQATKDQKTYEDTWKASDPYINLTKAKAPKEEIEKAKTRWSTGKNKI